MKDSGKIAVIGDKDVALAFKAVGVDVFAVTETAEIKQTLKTLTERNYSVVLITENEALKVADVINKMKMNSYPIIVPIPNGAQSLGVGMDKIYENTEKAIGSTVILGKRR